MMLSGSNAGLAFGTECHFALFTVLRTGLKNELDPVSLAFIFTILVDGLVISHQLICPGHVH